jgi:hypothetical protein
MSRQNLKTSQPTSLRAKQLKTIISQLKCKIKKIEKEGEVAPPNCHLIRYQVTQNRKIYWYYKLQASSPILFIWEEKLKLTRPIFLKEKRMINSPPSLLA